jgi:multidrug/hemolysin transport system permease protein
MRFTYLLSRNIKLFLRDKVTVFFSFLSVLILLLLYFLFIARNYVSVFADAPITESQKYFLIYTHVIAGVLILNGVSLSLGAFSVITGDFAGRKTEAFLLTPTKPLTIMLAYYTAGLLSVIVLNSVMYVAAMLAISAFTGVWFGVGVFFYAYAAVILSSVVATGIMMLFVVLVKSQAALGVLTGVLGTFLGFVCGIYMPFAAMASGVTVFSSFLPFSHFTVWLKGILLTDGYNTLGLPADMSELFNTNLGAYNIGFAGTDAPLWLMLLLSMVLTVGLLILSAYLLNRRLKNQSSKPNK